MAEGNQAAATDIAAEVARGVEKALAALKGREPAKPLTLTQRLAAIRDGCSGVGKEDIKMKFEGKDGKTQEVVIQGHTIGGVLHGVRPLLREFGVSVTPNLVDRIYNGNRCDVTVDFEWENLDDPTDRKVIRWAGSDTDKGGKGFAKAGTNCAKEHLKKLFLITDIHDAAEEAEQVEHQTDEGLSQASMKAAENRARDATEKWAKTFKLAVDKAESEKEVDRLFRDNNTQLAELPEITRQFFEKLKVDRKLALKKPVEPTKEEMEAADRKAAEEA